MGVDMGRLDSREGVKSGSEEVECRGWWVFCVFASTAAGGVFGAAVETPVVIMSEVPFLGWVDGFSAAPTYGPPSGDDRRPFLAEGAVGLVVAVTDSRTRRLRRHTLVSALM